MQHMRSKVIDDSKDSFYEELEQIRAGFRTFSSVKGKGAL
jgi:hypothetical protein